MSTESSRRAISTFRQRIGETAFAEHMRKLRDKRKIRGGPFRLDYVDSQGRTGSQLATAAGRIGKKAKKKDQS